MTDNYTQRLRELGEIYPCSVLTEGCHEYDELVEIFTASRTALLSLVIDTLEIKGKKEELEKNRDEYDYNNGFNDGLDSAIEYLTNLNKEL